MKKRIFALCSALLLSLTVFAGCGSKPTEESAASEPEATATSLASEARDAKAARTELDSQSETKDAPTRAEKADGSL